MDKELKAINALIAETACNGYSDYRDRPWSSVIGGLKSRRPGLRRVKSAPAIGTAGLAELSRITPLGNNMNYLGLLGVLFAAAKIFGYVSWPWLVVLSPFWLPFALLFALSAFFFAVMVIGALLK